MNCTNCGNPIQIGDQMCRVCGRPVSGSFPPFGGGGDVTMMLDDRAPGGSAPSGHVQDSNAQSDLTYCSNCGCCLPSGSKSCPSCGKTRSGGGLVWKILTGVFAVGFAAAAVFGIVQMNSAAQKDSTVRQLEQSLDKKDDNIAYWKELAGDYEDKMYEYLAEANGYSDEASEMQESVASLEEIYYFMQTDTPGVSSGNFYTNRPLVVLRESDSQTAIGITADFDGEYSVSYNRSGGCVSLEFAEEWQDGCYIELYVTPVSQGTATLTITNSYNDESFEVLVVVVSD